MTPVLIALALAASSPSQADAPRTYLLSLVDLRLDSKTYVSAFGLNTWGVTTLATCQIPPGWTVSAGSSADPSGEITGAGSLGVTWLDKTRVGYLEKIVLVRLVPPARKKAMTSATADVPETFEGHVVLGEYGSDLHARKTPLLHANIRLTPASRCPAPRF